MKTIKVSELKPGQAFTKPVYVDGENLLVPENIPIKEKDIKRLIKWGLVEVQTDGVVVPQGKKASSMNGDMAGDSGENEKIKNLYRTSLVSLMSSFQSFERRKLVDPKHFDDIITNILPDIIKHNEEWLNFALGSNREKENLAQGSLNATIFALVIGIQLSLNGEELIKLGTAALLHDLGMLRVPIEIRRKTDKLQPNELELIRTHPLHTYKMMTGSLKYPEDVSRIALLHHERWDGKGYPRQLAQKQIPLTTRILSVADAFEAMMRDKPYRESLLGYNAVRQILNDNSRRFDSDIIKVFIKSMGIYPVGSFVILNEGSVGVVVKIHSEAPLRPVIQILVTKEGKRLDKENSVIVDLLEDKNSFIARPFNPKSNK